MKTFCSSIMVLFCFHTVGFPDLPLFQKYKNENKCLIETGSYTGDGIQKALDAGYEQIYSIELSAKYYQICKDRFSSNSQVMVLWGDSGKILSQVLESIQEPITFWLDGHSMLLDTAKGDTMTPILEELEAIRSHSIKTHTILIDDIRLFGTWIFDLINLDTIIHKLREINPNYTIVFEDGYQKNDILVAFIPPAQ